MRKIFILFALLLCCFASSFAQQKDYYKKVPYFLSLNTSKLAFRLTHDLKTDSEKLCAIHAWITHKIKYDVKKWLKFDYSYQTPEKILWKRKTTCAGYSELFDALCKSASISSVTVPGYVKDIDVNITDKYYLDEHTWNAAFINDAWCLVDPCWDAGYIEYSKRTFWGFFTYLFSGGKYDIVKYKPHFVNHPNTRYFCKSPAYFKTDHLPLTPMWQLLAPAISIIDFKADSGFYYKRYDTAVHTVNKYDQYESQRQAYLAADTNGRMAVAGMEGHRFNYRNHSEIGEYYYVQTEIRMKDIDKKSRDTLKQIKACDTVLRYVNMALNYLDSNAYYLQLQKTELKHDNEQKRDTMTSQNKRLIYDTRELISHLLSGKSLAKSNVKSLKRLINNNNRKLKMALKNSSYSRKKTAKIFSEGDSVHGSILLQMINDSILHEEKKLEKTYSSLDSLFVTDSNKRQLYATVLPVMIGLECAVMQNRVHFYDDLDYEVRFPKDTLLRYKFNNDSLLYSQGKFRITELLHTFRNTKQDIDLLISLYKLKIAILKDYKGACTTSRLQDKEYNQTLTHWGNEVDEISGLKEKWLKRFRQLQTYCSVIKTETMTELKGFFLGGGGYFGERKLEYYFFAARDNYINKHSHALIKINNDLDDKMKVIRSKMLSYSERLGRK